MHAFWQWEQHLLARIRTVLLILAEGDTPESWQASADNDRPE
ncbi:MAG TPA: hypothetical protein VFW49_01055 [Fluviicoccus sp.]|nr:hypothetical protein [Fluviicoccus sp.]